MNQLIDEGSIATGMNELKRKVVYLKLPAAYINHYLPLIQLPSLMELSVILI